MSTTYYVRTYNCSFPTTPDNFTSILSKNGFIYLTNTSGTLTITYQSLNSFSKTAPYQTHQNGLVTRHASKAKPTKNSYGNNGYSFVDSYFFEYILNSSTDIYNLEPSKWTDAGWTSSNWSTFKTELCTHIENLKAYNGGTSVTTNFGSDNGEINVIFLIVKIEDISKTYYIPPLFYHGNDPQADETIVI